MKIDTRDFGKIEINEEAILHFPNGIIGFEEFKSYALIDPSGEGKFPMWLQSVDSVFPCFIVFDPNEISGGYTAEITKEEQNILEIDEKTAVCFLAIAIISESISEITVNMRSPIVINRDKNKALQIVLNNSQYSFRQPLVGKGV